MTRALLRIAPLAFIVAACSGEKDKAGDSVALAGTPAAASAGAAGPSGQASITGVVNFTGAAPANPTIDMSEEAACKSKHTGTITDPQYVVTGGKLGNVFVRVKSGLPAGATYPAPTTPVVVDQDGCLYKPRVFGVMVGQPIEIKNSDPVLHNIKAVPTANRGFNISQPQKDMKTSRTFTKEEVMVPLQCNVHSWMNAHVGVVSHPFFATSGPDGTFTISGLPAGTYELEAWHEKLGTQTLSVTVGATEAKNVTITFGTKA
jgi:plastocyanin